MKKMNQLKRKKEKKNQKKMMMESKSKKKKTNQKTKKRRKSKKLPMNSKNRTKPNHCGWEKVKTLLKMSTLLSTKPLPMTGKNTYLSNISQLKDNWNSKLCFSSLKEHHSICLKPKRKKITLNCMSEESSLWMTARTLFQNGFHSSKELLIQRTYP